MPMNRIQFVSSTCSNSTIQVVSITCSNSTRKYYIQEDRAYDFNTKKFQGYWIPELESVCFWADALVHPDLVLPIAQ